MLKTYGLEFSTRRNISLPFLFSMQAFISTKHSSPTIFRLAWALKRFIVGINRVICPKVALFSKVSKLHSPEMVYL